MDRMLRGVRRRRPSDKWVNRAPGRVGTKRDTDLTNDTNPTRRRDGDVAQRAEISWGTPLGMPLGASPSGSTQEEFVRAR